MKHVFYKSLVFFALAASPVIIALAANPANAGENIVVIELFTSQGCVACPPADKVMLKLANEEGVVALSWPVDYWDYLGWKDTFATAANTARQAGYNDAMGKNGVYTPQVVINGRVQAVGSRENEIRALIEEQKADGALKLDVTLDGDRENLVIDVSAGLTDADTSIWLILYDDEQVVDIQYGDNRGRLLRYAHRQAATLSLPRTPTGRADGSGRPRADLRVAVRFFVFEGIVGALRLEAGSRQVMR